MPKRGLGKGLEALIPQLDVSQEDVVTSIRVEQLRPNPYQPRQHFDAEKLDELAASIEEHGIIQPLIVRKSAIRGYDIVAGERRFRAAQQVGLDEVPVVVRSFSDVELMEIAIIENLQREDLNALEVAEAYANLMTRCNLTQERLAQRVGQSRSHVANMLRLLELPQQVREFVSRGTLTMGHARAVLAVRGEEEQVRLAERAVNEEMSVRKLESVVYQPAAIVSRETKTRASAHDTAHRHYEEQFRNALGTAVKIVPGKRRGKIEIEYFSYEDLERILQMLGQQSQ